MPKPKTKQKEEIKEEIIEPIGSDDDIDDIDDDDSLDDVGASRQASISSLSSLDHSDLFADFDPNDDDDIEDQFNSRITKLDDAPMVGGRGRSVSMFGNSAVMAGGRATSPRLLASASNMPSCVQLRIWKWENGVPVGLGAIDAQASEEDLVREFFEAMPKRGEGKCQFKLRPIDINGNELGTEITCIISEHHAAIQKIKRMKDLEKEEQGYDTRRKRFWDDDDDDSSTSTVSDFSPHMDRMLSATEKRMSLLEQQLEAEREEVRRREEQRMQEQVDLATSAAQGVQVLTERMMQDESKRAERAMQMQTEQSQTLITTLTSIFAQQQTMLQAHMEAQRRQDEYRLEQERQRANRERAEADARRERERLELEERRLREREEYERKIREERDTIERKLQAEQKQLEIRLQREREEMQLRVLRDKEEREARERWFAEERLRRDSQEREDTRQRELDRQRQHERMMRELELQQQKDREHAERMMSLSKQELQTKAMGGLGEMLPIATGMLEKFGLEPMDVVQKIFAPERDEPSVWSETLPKLLGAGADIARAAFTGNSPMPISQAQTIPQLPMGHQMEEIDYEAQLQRIRQPMPRQMNMEDMAIGGAIPSESPVISFRDTKLGYEVQPQQQQPQQQQQPANTMDMASQSGMTLSEQRDARNGMIQLVKQLHSSEQSEWEGIITQGLMSVPEIFPYIQAVTVRNAIREAGADQILTENIVKALQQSPIVPNTINYGA